MPGKLVIVHLTCARCGANVPLGGITTPPSCGACGWTDALPLSAFDWVLEPGTRSAPVGATVHGETRVAALACAACKANLGDKAIARALSARQSVVACPSCSTPTPLRPLSHDCAEVGPTGAPPRQRIDVPCSHCGAQLSIDGTTKAPVCTFCGTTNSVPTAIWTRFAPKRGYAEPFHVWSRLAQPRTSPKKYLSVLFGVVFGAIAIVAAAVKFWRAAAPAVVGGPCTGSTESCAPDGNSQLECSDGKYVVAATCRGPKGCRVTRLGDVSCDSSLASLGDPCTRRAACAVDGKSELRCDDGKFVLASACLGPDGCSVRPTPRGYALSCDDHVAPVGSPCLEDGRFACATDKRSMLRCTRGHFGVAAPCKGPEGCKIWKNRVDDTTNATCDGNIADVGDPCEADHGACRSDGKSLLECESGQYAVARSCRGGCVVTGDHYECRSHARR